MIKILDQHLINKIAAGEVVERPSSVVKELIENAIDARATSITLDVEEGGKQLIRVTDNGSGMDRYSLSLAVHPHATSKIATFEDLSRIGTFGFRGEALSSIAHVSDLSIISKIPQANEGYELVMNPLVLEKPIITPTAAKNGTVVTVKHLFKSIPARQKFLKSDTVEFSHILDSFVALALIHPEIAFCIHHNQRLIKQLTVCENLKDRIADVLGKDALMRLTPLSFAASGMKITGFISKPGQGERKPKHQYVYINRRPVKDYLILKAIKEGYENLIMDRELPNTIVHAELNTADVDVNVHPRKLEVKHQNPGDVFAFVKAAVKRNLKDGVLETTPARVLEQASIPISAPARSFLRPPQRVFQKHHYFQKPFEPQPASGISLFNGNTISPKLQTRRGWRLLGQIKNAYIALENEKGLLLIDQHAAQERINYECLVKQLHELNRVKKQQLLLPLPIELSLQDFEHAQNLQEALHSLGIEFDPFGDTTISLYSIPANLKITDPEKLFKDLLQDLRETNQKTALEELKKKMIDALACRSAVKFGDPLTEAEQIGLIETLEQTPRNNTCTHGRPVSRQFTMEEFEKMFKRSR